MSPARNRQHESDLNGENTSDRTALVIKPLDVMHLATTSESANGFNVEVAPIFESLCTRLFDSLGNAGTRPVGPLWARQELRDDGQMEVVAAIPVPAEVDVSDLDGIQMVDLRDVGRAATLVHTVDVSDCDHSYQGLLPLIDDSDEVRVGLSREIYLDSSGRRKHWVTKLQFVLVS